MCIMQRIEAHHPLYAVCTIHALNCSELKFRDLTIMPVAGKTIIPGIKTPSTCNVLATVHAGRQDNRCF